MMQNNSSQQPSNQMLEQLGVFVGEWNLEISSMSFDPNPSAIVRGHASFAWLEGGAFLLQRSEVPETDFPRGISVVGPDDKAETYGMLYFDSRGVSRNYQMSFDGVVWKLWRDFPGFSQRFTGTFSDDDQVITARWEKSSDNSNWELDFKVTYTRVR